MSRHTSNHRVSNLGSLEKCFTLLDAKFHKRKGENLKERDVKLPLLMINFEF